MIKYNNTNKQLVGDKMVYLKTIRKIYNNKYNIWAYKYWFTKTNYVKSILYGLKKSTNIILKQFQKKIKFSSL